MKKLNIILLVVAIALIIFCLVSIFGSDLAAIKESIVGSKPSDTNPTLVGDVTEGENEILNNVTVASENTVENTIENTIENTNTTNTVKNVTSETAIADMLKANNTTTSANVVEDNTTIANKGSDNTNRNTVNTTNNTTGSIVANNPVEEIELTVTPTTPNSATNAKNEVKQETVASTTQNKINNGTVNTAKTGTTNTAKNNTVNNLDEHNVVNKEKLPAAGMKNIVLWGLLILAVISIVSMLKYNSIQVK